ncbi:MAG: transglutaminase-like cysteine peptidase [Agarilytica sp.]
MRSITRNIKNIRQIALGVLQALKSAILLTYARVQAARKVARLCAIVALVLVADAGFAVSEKVLHAVALKYGEPARSRVEGWGKLIQKETSLYQDKEENTLTRANDYFNQVRWLSDLEHWGREDYWATPVETLATNGGDCEDFSIGKYFSLLQSEFDPNKLRITYVKSLTYDQAHMVLAYYERPDAEPLILDNINKKVLPASQRPDLLPIYSFNGDSIWLARDRGRKLKGSSQKSLPQWKALNERMFSDK